MAFQAHQRSFVMEEGFYTLRRISSSGGRLIAIQRHSNIRSDNDTLSEGIKINGLEQAWLLASAHVAIFRIYSDFGIMYGGVMQIGGFL